jgi:hypothetical protein
MLKKATLIFLVLLFVTTLAVAQTMKLEPFGASPRDVSMDANDIFDRAYNGLLNVGVQTQMYLKGTLVGGKLTNPTWTLTQVPTGSAATITKTVTVDSATQVAVFTPDVIGTFKVEFADGGKSATVTINSATYVGAFAGDGNCVLCHSSQADEWKKTGHFSLFEDALNGIASDHYGPNCISCHTTGYDTNAKNNGFDDRGFVFPDTLFPGQFDSMVVKYPNAMKLARIQCESCHGPGSAHNGKVDDSKMVETLSSDNCAWCHDSGSHHIFPYQWDQSRHGNPLNASRGSRTSCGPCHSGAGFVTWVKGGKVDLTTAPPVMAITCATCHEPHSDENLHQVRTVDAKLTDGTVITDGGLGLLCMNCHKSRDNAKTDTNEPGSHYGPHYAPQADVLAAANVVTFGKTLPTSPHIKGNACVECHMAETHETDPTLMAGAHTFSMVNSKGAEHVEACEKCHGAIGESFAEKKFYVNGNADHDLDGVEEGLQEEVHGLMEKLGALLPDSDPHTDPDSTWTLTELKAAYNHRVLYYDHSYGIHNPAFTVALLKVTIQALLNNAIDGQIVAIDDVPNDQGKQVRIIWEKFVDDGIALDPVVAYVVKRNDGDETWTGVGQHPADGSKRYALVVPTLYDSTDAGMVMTQLKVVALTQSGRVHESLPGKGYSVDNLVPQAPGNFMAMLAAGVVELSWEAPADPDINYYKVYRGADASFTPDESNMIGTTTDLTLKDTPAGAGNYFYVVAAVDFSGNLGKFSNPVNANLTSVAKDGAIPVDYALSQNYPNPFNPETSISFSLKQSGKVTLNIYNSNGQVVKTLVDHDMSAGNHSISFVADGLTSGLYIYRIMVTNGEGVQFQAVRKMVLMK